jgi:hypothetical protein
MPNNQLNDFSKHIVGTFLSRSLSGYPLILMENPTISLFQQTTGQHPIPASLIGMASAGHYDLARGLMEEFTRSSQDQWYEGGIKESFQYHTTERVREAFYENALKYLKDRIEEFEGDESPLKKRMRQFKRNFGFTTKEIELITLAYVMDQVEDFRSFFFDVLSEQTHEELKSLSAMLDLEDEEADNLLRGRLGKTFLLDPEKLVLNREFQGLFADK